MARTNQAKNIMSQTSIKRYVAKASSGAPISNTERLKAKRRRQMLEGKLGQEAFVTAAQVVVRNIKFDGELNNDPSTDMKSYYAEMHIQGKGQPINA